MSIRHLPIYNETFLEFFYEFEKSIRTRGYATVAMRMGRLREFLFFIESRGISRMSAVKAMDIILYCEYLKERPNEKGGLGLSEITIKGHLATIGLFFDYLTDAGYVPGSPVRFPRFGNCSYKERELLTVEEMVSVYDACINKRERAIVSLAYGCGLRKTEIKNLNASDLAFGKGTLTVREGKGNRSRMIPLSDAVIKDLRHYLIYERDGYTKPDMLVRAFIVNDIGGRMSGDGLHKVFRQVFLRTGIKKHITLHCLRHSLATHMLDKGADIEFVRTILGHRKLDTTHMYSKKRKQKLKLMQQFQHNGNTDQSL